ncbi:MAG TPA: peptide MFS transporter [Pyrinomonadaceae bacterium]|jgi:proton-dependent oligopeptide transporter, POT family|nr:peptide MFS transporter [Pyrinomonadaceae bacterium]
MSTSQDAAASSLDRSFFGHPAGLSTLFFTEMWERFSYYGMRAILLLYMTKTFAEGGLGLDEKYAGLIYGTYVSSVWYLPLPGGWLADRILGAKRAVLIGAIIIACGHFSMAVNSKLTFYAGLILIACGTGLLKPNISAMVGQLYSEEDKRRDSGFSIFYTGINLGAFLAPLLVGYLAQSQSFRNFIASWGFSPNSSWHWGFGAAGVGMTLGIIQYVLGQKRLAAVGGKPEIPSATAETSSGVDYVTLVLALVGGAIGAGLGLRFGEALISALFPTVVGFFFGYILGIMRHLKGEEFRRVIVIFILFVFSILFWMTYEQAGSSLTLFADRLTRTTIFGWTYPSSWFQAVPALFVIIFASIIGAVWLKLGDRQPSSPGKFTIGLFFAGIAFVVIAFASNLAGSGRVSPMWLVLVYFLQTIGELCLSPVGLSTTTKLSPGRMVGLMLGVWFLSISIGSYIAGLATGLFAGNDNTALTRGFGIFAGITLVAAIILAVLTPLIKRMTPRAQ